MSDTARASQTTVSGNEHPRRLFFKRAALATALAGVTAAIGIKAFAHADGPRPWRPGGFIGGDLDPATMDAHLDRMLMHLYAEIDATDAQKQQLGPIVKGAAADLLPLRAKMRDARQQAVALLSQEQIDRAALEALRAGQLQLAEQASRRLTQALADVADVLTVDQRKQLAERIGRWRGHRG
jgi:protein CpxP